MKKIAWITDSTCSLTPEFAKEHNIVIVPMIIDFNGDVYKDGVTISENEFYQKLSTSEQLPKSSQPSIGEMAEMYEELKKEYDMGIAIHLSSELSGTANASKQAANIAGFPLEMIDTRLISLPMAELIIKGKEMIESGVPPEETADKLRNMHKQNSLYVTIGSLDQLHKGGRVNTMQLMVGNLLQIKPILKLEDGKLEQYEKVRSKKKALGSLLTYLENDIQEGKIIKKVYLLNGNAGEEFEDFKEKVNEQFPNLQIVTGALGAAVGVHAGAGTVGIGWFEE